MDETTLSDADRKHAAGLMRVNHAGEIAAQGLYQGHAAVARRSSVESHIQEAAQEEFDHLAWCEQRLEELGEKPSLLSPAWYMGAFLIGAASGVLGDKWSLGFVACLIGLFASYFLDLPYGPSLVLALGAFFICAIILNLFPSNESDLLSFRVSALIKLLGLGVLTTSMVVGGLTLTDIDANQRTLLLLLGLVLLIIYSVASPALEWSRIHPLRA